MKSQPFRHYWSCSSEEVRYFVGSRKARARANGQTPRNDWSVEKGLHWHLDVNFGEDESRNQKRRGGENFAVLRRIALSLLQQNPARKSIACKRLAAAFDTGFLEETLRGDV